ncbi:hypothetical protein BIU98_14895 [Curtobacterium sp. MMLR14_010]|nr:hypothetical protein BIU98_14895 [Curtobacterium sp. MMLR14_010]
MVIVVFDTDPVLLDRCLSSLETLDASRRDGTEIIVVDNSPHDDLGKRFSTGVAQWIRGQGNVGFGRAANLGIQAARGEAVLLLNPDAAVSPRAVAALQTALGEINDEKSLLCGWLTKADGVQVDAYMHWWSSTGRLLRRERYRRYLTRQWEQSTVVVQKVSGGALFARRSVLLDLGPFDERFFLYGEDADLSVRARGLGYQLYAVPDAFILHEGASSQTQHSSLVERARVDAAIRIARYHLRYPLSLLVELDLLLISALGLILRRAGSSGSIEGRRDRLAVIRDWGLRRDRQVFEP